MTLRDAPASVPVTAQLVIYPGTDYSNQPPSYAEFADGFLFTQAGHHWYREHYDPIVNEPRASPLLGNLNGLPPAVVLTAGLDIVRDEGRAYAAGLVQAGVPTTFLEAKGMIHGFVLLRRALPSGITDIAKALDALPEHSEGRRCPKPSLREHPETIGRVLRDFTANSYNCHSLRHSLGDEGTAQGILMDCPPNLPSLRQKTKSRSASRVAGFFPTTPGVFLR